jgi:hypothetical protein
MGSSVRVLNRSSRATSPSSAAGFERFLHNSFDLLGERFLSQLLARFGLQLRCGHAEEFGVVCQEGTVGKASSEPRSARSQFVLGSQPEGRLACEQTPSILRIRWFSLTFIANQSIARECGSVEFLNLF